MKRALVLAALLAAPSCDGNGAAEQAPRSMDHGDHAQPPHAPAPSGVEGHAEVMISPERQQLIGLATAPVTRVELAGDIRAPAILTTDETREASVHTKLAGWVQQLFVGAVGERVERGAPLYSLYSQELYVAQQEYRSAHGTAPELARAARQRMLLWDVPPAEIARIERGGPRRAVTFVAPVSGTVIEKDVLAGQYVDAGAKLYRIADLSRVWALAEVYEFEVSRIDEDGEALVHIQGVQGPRRAAIDHVYPTIDEATRTVRVRLVLPNPDGDLRPGGFATVELPTARGVALAVPRDAVIDTGRRKVVYLAKGEGHFAPVEVTAGRTAGEMVEIRAGLEEGQQVVVSGQFLLDSESRLRAVGGETQHGGH